MNNPPTIATNRKCLLHKYLRIISHLLFRPFKSIFSIPGKLFKETNCPRATQSEARLESSCSPGRFWGDTSTSFLCSQDSTQKSSTCRLLRYMKGCNLWGQQGRHAAEPSQTGLWCLSKGKRMVCVRVRRHHKFSHAHPIHLVCPATTDLINNLLPKRAANSSCSLLGFTPPFGMVVTAQSLMGLATPTTARGKYGKDRYFPIQSPGKMEPPKLLPHLLNGVFQFSRQIVNI